MKRFDWTLLFTRPYKVYTQLVFWAVVFFLYIFLKEYPSRMTGATLICLVLQETLELAIPSYTQNLLVLPFFKKKKWALAIILYLVQVVLLIELLPYILNAVGALFPIKDKVDWRNEHIAFSVIAFTVIASCVKVAIDRLMLDKEQKENELRHLKAQLNPHFLFNTLNNLYGLSVAESKKLPDLMLKLSGLLRYSLYDTNQQYVPLQKELDYITNYVALEQLRLDDKAKIELSIDGNSDELYIAPLLLIVFIENCFKHFSAAPGGQRYVMICFNLNGAKLSMQVKNSVDPNYQPEKKKVVKGGIGLANVRQRLDLIYPQTYKLDLKRENDYFDVTLIIELD